MMDASRKKPWYRLRNILLIALVLIVMAVGWFTIEVWRVYAGKPNVTRDFVAEFRVEVEKTGVSLNQADQAWAKFAEAIAVSNQVIAEHTQAMRDGQLPRRVDEDGNEISYIDFSHILDSPSLSDANEPEYQILRLIEEQGAFRLLDELASLGVGYRPRESSEPLIFQAFDDLGQARQLALARVLSMRLAASKGNANDVADAFEQLLAMSSTISYQPGVIFHLVAQSIQSLAFTELTFLLDEMDFDEQVGRSLLRSLDRYPLAPVSLSLEGERFVFLDIVQHWYTDDGAGDGYIDAGMVEFMESTGQRGTPRRTLWGSTVGRFILPGRRDTVACYNEYIDNCIGESQLPGTQRWVNFDPRVWADALPKTQLFVKLIAPALAKFIDNGGLSNTRQEATRIMIALHLYRAIHQEFPEELEQLTPDLLREVPADPTHGGAFVYRRVENEPLGRPYLLYSTGRDQSDDGGHFPHEAWMRFESLTKEWAAGTDCVFNVPRRELRPR